MSGTTEGKPLEVKKLHLVELVGIGKHPRSFFDVICNRSLEKPVGERALLNAGDALRHLERINDLVIGVVLNPRCGEGQETIPLFVRVFGDRCFRMLARPERTHRRLLIDVDFIGEELNQDGHRMGGLGEFNLRCSTDYGVLFSKLGSEPELVTGMLPDSPVIVRHFHDVTLGATQAR